jgi:tetratricopeptide (TPR) repeat protein
LDLDNKAVRDLEFLKDNFPTKHENLNLLALAYNNLGKVLTDKKQYGQAESNIQNAISLVKRLTIDFPTYHHYRKVKQLAYYNLGNVQWDTGRYREAEDSWREAEKASRALAENPGTPEYKSLFGNTLQNLGLALRKGKKLREACDKLREAIKQQRVAIEKNPENPSYPNRLLGHYRQLAITLQKFSSPDACQCYEAAQCMARCVPLAKNAQLAKDFARAAVKFLCKARKLGLTIKAEDLSKDEDFARLADDSSFQRLLRQLRQKR